MTNRVVIIDAGINEYFIPSELNTYQVKEEDVCLISNSFNKDELTHGTICATIFL
ncbi:hypothetical protein J2Z32_000626 [Paenibacillus turicensis]|uniref:Peptidase S8/S53 domain-containing protein n=1 Tax=Paenibacillus turicensis TaxID=160487 RepID=A0ABS4FN53_9BACL|nr:hypothetical protein [Paenibacillus turicensis]MBP1904009.1 hypothetical protein [Paenibacillus turicensis]